MCVCAAVCIDIYLYMCTYIWFITLSHITFVLALNLDFKMHLTQVINLIAPCTICLEDFVFW